MYSYKQAKFFSFILIGLFFLSSCSPTATKNLTLASPTQTLTPKAETTVTPQPTPTSIVTPEATATAEAYRYAIDMEKLMNKAPSYEYMVAHPDEFQQAPDILSDVEAFKEWYYNKYKLALLNGNDTREANIDSGAVGMGGDLIQITAVGLEPYVITKDLPISYFIHDGVMYPILAFTFNTPLGHIGTRSIILHPEDGSKGSGFGAINELYEGKGVFTIYLQSGISVHTPDVGTNSEFLNDGFNWFIDEHGNTLFMIGLGKIVTK